MLLFFILFVILSYFYAFSEFKENIDLIFHSWCRYVSNYKLNQVLKYVAIAYLPTNLLFIIFILLNLD